MSVAFIPRSRVPMADRIKSFVRVRPVTANPPDVSGVKVNGNKIGVSIPGEVERTVDQVFNDMADQTAVWEAVAKPACEAMLNGEFSCVLVGGQSGAGKSYTVYHEEDGIVGNVLKTIAGQEDANMCVLLFRNDTIQDLITGSEGLKLKYDDVSGAQCDGATYVRVTTATAAFDHIKKCMEKKAEILEKVSTAEQNCFIVYAFAAGAGRMNVIDCCGSQRVWKASLTADEKKVLTDKNKIWNKLAQCWLDSAVNADPKAIGWKDTKVGRFIQQGLSQAMEGGKGYAALLMCVHSGKQQMYETLCSIDLAERCVKQESLKSVSVYKEMIQDLEERLDANKKEEARLQAEAKAQEQAALKVKADNEARIQELQEKEEMLKMRVSQAKQQAQQEIERAKKDYEKKKVDLEKKNVEDLERLRNLAKNAPQQAEIDTKKKIEEVEEAHQAKMREMNAELAKLKAEIAENKEIIAELKELKEEHEKEEQQAMKPVRELEKELAKLNEQLATAGKSREDGLSAEEIEERRPLWELRDELDDIEEEIQKVALECIAMDYGLANGIGKPASAAASSEADSDESDSDSGSGSDSDSDSDSDDSDSDDSDEDERAAQAAKLQAEIEAAKQEEERRQVDRVAYDKELAHFRETVNKDTFLAELLDKIVLYLEYGTNVTVLREDGSFSRHFVYLANKKQTMCFGPEAKDTSNVSKGSPQMSYPLASIVNIIMGQHSKKYLKELKKVAGRVDPPRSELPPTAEELSTSNLHRYYYRSLSLELAKDKNGEDQTVDMICDTQTDFEAMVVAYHRLTLKEAFWGKKLYIDFCEEVDKLEPFEKTFCEGIHLTPQHYLFAKAKVLETDERLFITLHDLRVISGLDLFHSQRLLELWTKQRWIVRRQVNYFKYQEKLLASAEAAKQRAEKHADPVPPPTSEMDDVL